jgi:hypothetical protein
MRKDLNGSPIPSGTYFTTEATAELTSSYEEIVVPDRAAEFFIDADGVTLGESDSADGSEIPAYFPIGVGSMENIYLKGSGSVNIVWIFA